MKTKDYIRKLLGKPTSEDLRRQEKHARKADEKVAKDQQREQRRQQQRQAIEAIEQGHKETAQQLAREFENEAAKPGFDLRIPHPNENFNQHPTPSYREYYKRFTGDFVLRTFPGLLDIAGFKAEQQDFVMFDYGCGLARLGFAFTNYFGAPANRRYIGYEIHPDAMPFFQKAYAAYPNTRFFGDVLEMKDSYVEIQQQRDPSTEPARIDAAEVNLRDRVQDQIDVQFSSSVFTHMYRKAIVHVLKEFAAVLKPGGVCVNTWLIVDALAESSLRCGLADRVLPFESKTDGFLYYMEDNPLMCSAYRLEAMRDIYAEAGHEIIDIRWGKWSGRTHTQDMHWQDVVISRPKR